MKLMWRKTLNSAWTEAAGCLIIRCESQGRVSFDYPVAGPEGDEDAALTAIEGYCLENGIQPEISIVPECKAPVLLARYPYVRVSNIRTWRDYLYYKEDLQLFAGRRYSGQRNHIPVGGKHAIVIDNNSGALLSPVLQGVQRVIGIGRHIGGLRRSNAEHAAFFMDMALPAPALSPRHGSAAAS